MSEATPVQHRRRRPPIAPATALLLERGISAVSVADEIGVNRQTVSYQLTGERPMRRSTLDAIARLTDKRVANAILRRPPSRCRRRRSVPRRHGDHGGVVMLAPTTWDEVALSNSLEQAGAVLGVSRSAVYRLIRAGKLEAVKVSERRLVVPKAALQRFLRDEALPDREEAPADAPVPPHHSSSINISPAKEVGDASRR